MLSHISPTLLLQITKGRGNRWAPKLQVYSGEVSWGVLGVVEASTRETAIWWYLTQRQSKEGVAVPGSAVRVANRLGVHEPLHDDAERPRSRLGQLPWLFPPVLTDENMDSRKRSTASTWISRPVSAVQVDGGSIGIPGWAVQGAITGGGRPLTRTTNVHGRQCGILVSTANPPAVPLSS